MVQHLTPSPLPPLNPLLVPLQNTLVDPVRRRARLGKPINESLEARLDLVVGELGVTGSIEEGSLSLASEGDGVEPGLVVSVVPGDELDEE
jgi:hypothetical protein